MNTIVGPTKRLCYYPRPRRWEMALACLQIGQCCLTHWYLLTGEPHLIVKIDWSLANGGALSCRVSLFGGLASQVLGRTSLSRRVLLVGVDAHTGNWPVVLRPVLILETVVGTAIAFKQF